MKLGIVGNGMIVDWLLRDIRELPEITAEALCVRERSLGKGQLLAKTYGISAVYTDYAAFLDIGDFDTVYIGIVNSEHFSYARRALEAGKHVICEKPFTVTAQEAHILAELAEERGLFLWEAFKIPYGPVFQAVKRHLSGVGEVKLVQCNFCKVSSRYASYQAGEVLPAFDPACGGGCLYDINLYNIHFVTGLFGRPEQVYYFANRGYNGVDTSGILVMQYQNFQAVCTGAKDSASPGFGMIQGTEGYIRVEGPVSACSSAQLYTRAGEVRLAADDTQGALTGEMREFARQLQAGERSSCYEMLKHSVMVMELAETAARHPVTL